MCLWATVSWGRAGPSLEGVGEIAAPGLPGAISVWGESARVLVTAPDGELRLPLVGAAEFAMGRAVAFAHEGYLAEGAIPVGDTRELMNRVMAYLTGGKDKPRVAALGRKAFARALAGEVIDLGADPWANLDKCDVLVVAASEVPVGRAAAVVEFVRGGGGLLIAETGWGWQQLNPDGVLARDNGGNVALRQMGMAFTTQTTGADRVAAADSRVVDLRIPFPPETHARSALTALEDLSAKDIDATRKARRKLASAVLLPAADLAPPDSTFGRELAARLIGVKLAGKPTPANPLDETRPFERVALMLEMRRENTGEVSAHPTATAFPGSVPDGAERVRRVVSVNLSVPRWITTGLYAAPGETIRVTMPPGTPPRDIRLRIGAHTDDISHLPVWKRVPMISRSFPLAAGENAVASPFGGAVYVEVVKPRVAKADIAIAGAVEAPLFVLGQTTPEQWARLRHAPAPWAEFIVPGRVVLTFRSDSVRELDDPTEVMEHWKRVLDAMADLAGIPRDRPREERIVTDVQISVGYMHSGYPIMTHLDVSRDIVDLAALKTVKGGWGFYHELGHNHQVPDWTFEGTGEVTNNVFVHYVLETVCNLPVPQATARALGPDTARILKAHLESPDFARWQREPFLALAMYAQVHTAFGWEPFKKVFAEYESLPDHDRPTTEQAKRDQWMIRLSRAVNKNLGPFFDAWGVPVSSTAKAEIAALAHWLPEGITPRP